MKTSNMLILNKKKFLPVPKKFGDFSEIFRILASEGVGRTVDENGFIPGPWTPESLAAAISEIDDNTAGIELRTVQRWFDDSDGGISNINIKWLARIAGCEDPTATSDWQRALADSKAKLISRRRKKRRSEGNQSNSDSDKPNQVSPVVSIVDVSEDPEASGLAIRVERLFSRGSPLDLAIVVFACAVALGFVAYLTGIHSAVYLNADGVAKQVGYIWSPNWTVLFMVFMPLFFVFAVDLVMSWRFDIRAQLLGKGSTQTTDRGWMQIVRKASFTHWTIFVVLILFAGIFQWFGVRLLPLLGWSSSYAIDWGTLSLAEPEKYSRTVGIAFTGFAYLYMCLTFYLFFAGLILLYTVTIDHSNLRKSAVSQSRDAIDLRFLASAQIIMKTLVRCTICGICIAMCMNLQSLYVTNKSTDVVSWIYIDLKALFEGSNAIPMNSEYSRPNQYTSLMIAVSSCVPLVFGLARLRTGDVFRRRVHVMVIVVFLVFVSYLSIGVFPGFSLSLILGTVLAIYGVIDPSFERLRPLMSEEKPYVS